MSVVFAGEIMRDLRGVGVTKVEVSGRAGSEAGADHAF